MSIILNIITEKWGLFKKMGQTSGFDFKYVVPGKLKRTFLWMKQVEFNMDFMVHTMYYITYHVVLHTEFTLRQFVALL